MTPLLALSDVVWQAVIAGIVTVALATLQVWATLALRKMAQQATGRVEAVREAVEEQTTEVKQAVEVQTAETAVKLDAIHALGNSAMGEQLRLGAELSRWKANQTGDPRDSAAADKAERLYAEHQARQAAADLLTKSSVKPLER